jgi:hypothetical protein
VRQLVSQVICFCAAVCRPACELSLILQADLSISINFLPTWCLETRQAEQLAALLRRFDLRSHVNVIPVRLWTSAPCMLTERLHEYPKITPGFQQSHLGTACSMLATSVAAATCAISEQVSATYLHVPPWKGLHSRKCSLLWHR